MEQDIACKECGEAATAQIYYTSWYKNKVEMYYPVCKKDLERISSKFQPHENLGYLSIIIKPFGPGIELVRVFDEEGKPSNHPPQSAGEVSVCQQ